MSISLELSTFQIVVVPFFVIGTEELHKSRRGKLDFSLS